MSVFETIRRRCAAVVDEARFVHIDPERLDAVAASLASERPEVPSLDPGRQRLTTDEATLAFVVTLNAVNFGSGWFPHLRKQGALSGYLTVASRLRDRFEQVGAFSAVELETIRLAELRSVLDQPEGTEVDELLGLFQRALADLGGFLRARFDGSFEALVAEAGGSAARLVALLAEMPLYRDVSIYRGAPVPFYKRAQITCADLSTSFDGAGPGRFEDLAELTIFADNLVPHVLRMLGVLGYDAELEQRIDAGVLLASGAPEEVEIRASALHAVEAMAAACAARGWPSSARELDHLLWARGQDERVKAVPRHRTRCTYY